MGTRAQGLATGPITFGEIEAYRRIMVTDLSPWDVKLIRRLDVALQAQASGTPVPGTKTDVGSMKSMLRGLAAAKAKAQGDQNAGSR